jgi:hypothetical protein
MLATNGREATLHIDCADFKLTQLQLYRLNGSLAWSEFWRPRYSFWAMRRGKTRAHQPTIIITSNLMKSTATAGFNFSRPFTARQRRNSRTYLKQRDNNRESESKISPSSSHQTESCNWTRNVADKLDTRLMSKPQVCLKAKIATNLSKGPPQMSR